MSEILPSQKEYAGKIMTAFWQEIVKPFYNAEDTDEYWKRLVDKLDELMARYDLANHRQLLEMMYGFICGLEITGGNERKQSYLYTVLQRGATNGC